VKKVAMLFCVLICVQLDNVLGTPGVCRTAIMLFFIGNEGLSIVENMGLMGVPLPDYVKNALAMLKNKNNTEPKG
jgi:toxin secretion/phage lysis holin